MKQDRFIITEEFSLSLYREHLEEASCLFEQRQSLLTDREISWIEIEEFEDRLLAHIDALEIGGELAINYAMQFLREDAEEYDISVAVYLLSLPNPNNPEGISYLFNLIQDADREQVCGFFETLRLSPNKALADRLLQCLYSERSEIVYCALRVLTERCLIKPVHVLPLLKDQHNIEVIIVAIQVLGRSNDRSVIRDIEPFTIHENEMVRKAAFGALLYLGYDRSFNLLLDSCQNKNPYKSWVTLYAALTGGSIAYSYLIPQDLNNSISHSIIQAIGILGNIKAVEFLLKILTKDNIALYLPAARALHLITCAGLMETISITEEISPDELLEGEESPESETREIVEICRSFDVWNKWWQENKKLYREGTWTFNGHIV